ncbi:hypothetical protein QBC36DRAFT_361526 [Triangularia setosa]|uniref:Uncharacterized protein n=1 Tax=Triangularia setosa TaxID=2587417 RepID=A0AAN7A582_9PEZI|nr:hypothetical protein QBC36DRAFT_361526 [Podospora setosa]
MSSSKPRPEQQAPFGSPPKPPPPTWQGPSNRYGGDSSRPPAPVQKSKPEDYKYLPSFEYVNLTKLKVHNPSLYAAVATAPDSASSSKTPKPPKIAKLFFTKPPSSKPLPKPLGYTPQPPMSLGFPQHLCPICSTPIGYGEGQDFTGNLPCKHRGPCSSEPCIMAYYGSLDRWALPYTGSKPVFCQAPGCRAQIEAWCQVKCQENKSSTIGQVFHNDAYRDPKVVEAEEERRWKTMERERAEEAAAQRLARPPREWSVGCKARSRNWAGAVVTCLCCWSCMLCDWATDGRCGEGMEDCCCAMAFCCGGGMG